MIVVRIEPPTKTVLELRSIPDLLSIEMHPPAAGPEVELVFADLPEGSEEAFRERVELATGCRILALAIRRVKA